jgi:hypothetical protein
MEESTNASRALAASRIEAGLLQGLALYLLSLAAEHGTWPASDGLVFAPFFLLALFVPILVTVGLGTLRPRSLLLWIVAASVALVVLGLHDMARGGAHGWWFWAVPEPANLAPSPGLLFYAAVGLFIAQNLVFAGDSERRVIASYASYFDVAWKHGVQLALALGFTGIFWALLYLGAQLFELVKLDFLSRLIEHRWFAIPVTTGVFAYAIHVTDVRVALVRGIRTLSLTLLSWLLPMMALLAAGFVVALGFTGLEPLWSTRYATQLLLVAAASLVVLLNAAYQDGEAERAVPLPLRWSGSLAAVVLVPLVAIAAYGLSLRVRQYGWTPDRIAALAFVIVGACYAAGYAAAAFRPGSWLRWVGATNVATAFVILAVLVALFSPIADPARISVADQVARLREGRTAPERFDFTFLRFDGARYGTEALEQLRQLREGPAATQIAEAAERALKKKTRWDPGVATPVDLAANITPHPAGRALPAEFLSQRWTTGSAAADSLLPRCLTRPAAKCDAFLVDLDDDGAAELLLVPDPDGPSAAFKVDADRRWAMLGTYSAPWQCKAVRKALRAGEFRAAEPHGLRDLEAGGMRLRLQPAPVTACE